MAPSTAVVLFRQDLRVDDHAPLRCAVEDADRVIPLVCIDPEHFKSVGKKKPRLDDILGSFLLDSVRKLRESLQHLGANLFVRIGAPDKVLPEFCEGVRANAVYMHCEVCYEDQLVEEKLGIVLGQSNIQLTRFWGGTLHHLSDIPFGLDEIPDNHREYCDSVDLLAIIRGPEEPPSKLRSFSFGLDIGSIPLITDFFAEPRKAFPKAHTVQRASASRVSVGLHPTGGELEANKRLCEFGKSLTSLWSMAKSQQILCVSHLLGGLHCLSPWLRFGCISPRRVYWSIREISVKANQGFHADLYKVLSEHDYVYISQFRINKGLVQDDSAIASIKREILEAVPRSSA